MMKQYSCHEYFNKFKDDISAAILLCSPMMKQYSCPEYFNKFKDDISELCIPLREIG